MVGIKTKIPPPQKNARLGFRVQQTGNRTYFLCLPKSSFDHQRHENICVHIQSVNTVFIICIPSHGTGLACQMITWTVSKINLLERCQIQFVVSSKAHPSPQKRQNKKKLK